MKKIILILLSVLLVGCNNYQEEPVIEEIPEEKEIEEVFYEKIETELDYDYENITLSELIKQVCEEHQVKEEQIYLFYENYKNGETYSYQDEEWIMGASTMKVPLNMMIIDRINEGKLSSEATFYYHESSLEGGDGETRKKYVPGNRVPLSFLREQSIIYSDNTATNILLYNLGYQQFKDYFRTFYEQEYPSDFNYYNLMNVRLMHAVTNHLYENQEQYKELLEWMKVSSYGGYLKKNLPDVEIAHKYGNYAQWVHDFGIVFDDKVTYSIGIFTNGIKEIGLENGDEFIAYLSQAIYEYTLVQDNLENYKAKAVS